MWKGRLAFAAIVALALAAPAAMAAEGRGGFLAPSPAALWGSLRLDGAEAPASLMHQGDPGSLTGEASQVVVRVETVRSGSEGADQHDVEEHRFTDASLSDEAGAGVVVHIGPGTVLSLAAQGPAPQSLDEAQRQPDAIVASWDSWRAWSSGRDPGMRSCGPRACSEPSGMDGSGLALLPFQPVGIEGKLELLVLPGSSILVKGAEGEQRFASEQREEVREEGGVVLPVVGRVGGQEERTYTATYITVTSEEARVAVQPAAWGFEDRAPERSGATAQDSTAHQAKGTSVAGQGLVLHLDGALALHEAHGAVDVEGQRHEARGGDVLLEGSLKLSFAAMSWSMRPGPEPMPTPMPPYDSRPYHEQDLQVQVEGDVRRIEVQGPSGDSTVYQAAMVAGAAGALGILALFAPAAKYGFSRVVALPLYARLERQQLLDNGLRASLLEIIRREPGRSPAELAKQVPCSWSTLVYHLSVLEREGYVSKAREGRRWRFFPTGQQDHSQLPALALMNNPRAARLLEEVRAQPGIAQHTLSARVALSPSTVHFHMRKLLEVGVVRAERDGRVVRYFPGPPPRGMDEPGPPAA